RSNTSGCSHSSVAADDSERAVARSRTVPRSSLLCCAEDDSGMLPAEVDAAMPVRTIEWRSGCVVMLDQRVLPTREVYRVYRDYREVARAIKDMVIRGAPAIGVAAAMGIALGARTLRAADPARDFERLCRAFASTRPTAVNLFWAIQRMRRVFSRNKHRSLDT